MTHSAGVGTGGRPPLRPRASVTPDGPARQLLVPSGGEAPDPMPSLDLARLLIPDPACTLLLRVCGDSMEGAGIRHGDLLVVERDRRPASGAIVVARLGGCFTLKQLVWRRGRCWLEPAHPSYPSLDLEATARGQGLTAADVQLWGVAVHVIRPLLPPTPSLPRPPWPAPPC